MAKNQDWTPREIRNKTAEKWQGALYGIGALAGLASWGSFSGSSGEAGIRLALVAIVAFGLGGLIKTTWVKHAQVNIYIKDKARETLRWKFYGAGVLSGVFTVLALNGGAKDAGGFFAIVSVGAMLVGGLLPIKWVKRGEIGAYK